MPGPISREDMRVIIMRIIFLIAYAMVSSLHLLVDEDISHSPVNAARGEQISWYEIIHKEK